MFSEASLILFTGGTGGLHTGVWGLHPGGDGLHLVGLYPGGGGLNPGGEGSASRGGWVDPQ